MKYLFFFFALLLCGNIPAQWSFRISDSTMNDVTEGTLYVSDTDAQRMHVALTIQNTDSVAHEVKVLRIVDAQPGTVMSCMTWGNVLYLPVHDTSYLPERIVPAGSAQFTGYYFPNNTADTTSVRYCFSDAMNVNDYSCVTVVYTHSVDGGGTPAAHGEPVRWQEPGAITAYMGTGWSHGSYDRIDLYAWDGSLVSSATSETGFNGYEYNLTNMPAGIYYIHCSDSSSGSGTSFTFVHPWVHEL
jgi:hypothetical protein